MVESESDMKIDLLSRAQMIQSARIQELARTSILGVIADIFHKQAGLLGYLFFDRKGGFRHAFGRYVRGTEELGQHTAHAPTFIQFPRPWQLQVRLRAAARYVDRTGRKRHADDHGQVDLPRYRTDLPLYRRSNIRKPRTSRSADVCKIRRQIQQQLQARRYAQAPSGVCAIDRSTAVPSADIHSVLALKTARGHDEAGVRDIRPVRCDFVLGGRTTLRLCVHRAEYRNRRQQTDLESSSAHENLDRRTTGWRHWRKTTELDERFHENDPMGFDLTFVIPGCVPAGDSRSGRRPGIHSPCGGYGFRARLSRASRVTRAPE